MVQPGRVPRFLGPNGAGRSTTMRLMMGLDAPTRGSAIVNGKPYRRHMAPPREVPEGKGWHSARGRIVPLSWGYVEPEVGFEPTTFRLRDGCSASIWTAPDGSSLLTLDGPSV